MPFRILSIYNKPYITKFDPIPGSDGFYEFDGMFPEVVFGLRVRPINVQRDRYFSKIICFYLGCDELYL